MGRLRNGKEATETAKEALAGEGRRLRELGLKVLAAFGDEECERLIEGLASKEPDPGRE